MIKTIIVDDEVWACKLICNIVDWESYGYEVIKQIYSGTEALAVIAAEKPDLVFTDIRMPGIDGLSLIREAGKISPDTKFVKSLVDTVILSTPKPRSISMCSAIF